MTRIRVLFLAVTLLCAVSVPAARATGSTVDAAFYSHGIEGVLHFEAYLPPDYDSSGLRYPVVYFLHGLPAGPGAYRSSVGWLEQALAQAGQKAIIVAPQGARDRDTDPEYLDWGPGRNWETALAKELPAYVDATFRTIPSRNARALIGLSAGGYGATLVALHHLDTFSVIESWSGYFHPTDPTGTRALDLGSARRNAYASAHAFVRGLRQAFTRQPTFFAFYVGDGDSFAAENRQLHRELAAAHVPHVFRVYSGGPETSLWTAHAASWLQLALQRLEQPQ